MEPYVARRLQTAAAHFRCTGFNWLHLADSLCRRGKCEAVGGDGVLGDKSGAAVRQEAEWASAGVSTTKKAQLKYVSANVLVV